MSPWLCVSQYGTCQLQLPRKAVCTNQSSTQAATTWAQLEGSKASRLNVPQLLVTCVILQISSSHGIMGRDLCLSISFCFLFSPLLIFLAYINVWIPVNIHLSHQGLSSPWKLHLETFWKITESDNKCLNVHLECTTESQKLAGCLAASCL